MKKIAFTTEQIEEIINLYVNHNYTQKSLSEKYSVSRSVIKRILQENFVDIRKTTTKYTANYDIFEDIDSPEKAYWLGFLAADGCVYKRDKNASIILNLHQKDKNHLEKFKMFMNSNAEINCYIQNGGFSNNTPMARFVLNSVKMANDLINKGVVPKKSLILNKPNINEEFYLPYILGYFDGDGSISFNKNNEFYISIQGTKEILTWINEVLGTSLPLEKRNKDNKNSYYIRCGGLNKPYKILKTLYDSVEINLERKYKIYQKLETVVLNRNIK